MTAQVYVVGGSVRDMLLGQPPRDLDFCVTGATPADMLQLGFVQVGADFPVFLHPHTHDEFALARTERKVAAGYGGFSTSTAGVTLQEDLMRRDLTINAMAYHLDRSLQQLVADPLSAEQWANEFDVQQVIDPFAGKADLADRIFRHVGPAFAEDPLRVLRVARFQARLGPNWQIAPELQAQAAQLHAAGELAALVPERIGKEVLRAVQEPHACLLPKAFQQLSLDALGIKWQSDISIKQTQSTGPSLHEAVWACFQPSWIQSCSWIPADTKRFAAKVDRMLSSQLDTSVHTLVVELTQMRLFNMTAAVDLAVLDFVEILDPANIRLRAWNKAKHIKTVDCPPGPAYAQALTQARVAAILAADSA